MTRDSRASFRRRNAATERDIDAGIAEHNLEQDARWKAARDAAQAAEAARHVFTRDELLDVAAVRTIGGWHRVVHVNRKTVTVATNYTWDDRVPFAKVLEVHRLPNAAS